MIRIPDVSFIDWRHFPARRVPPLAMFTSGPDLAVEVLSPSNTAREMADKLRDYFGAGVRLVWYVDPRDRSVRVYAAVDQVTTLRAGDNLTGDPVLPGFVLPLADLFGQLAG